MPESRPNRVIDAETADERWKDLYRIGGIACFALAVAIVLAVTAYFIWPYKPGFSSTADVFATLQKDRIGGLMALDLLLVVGTLLSLLPLLAVYAALKGVNESYALIALTLGAIGVLLIVPARPISELVSLSELHATAMTEAAKSQYLAAGEALLAQFNGTAWLLSTGLGSAAWLILSFLMLRGNVFSRATAYVGIITNVTALCFVIPVVGIPLLFVSTVFWLILQVVIGRRLLQLAQGKPVVLQAEGSVSSTGHPS